jgi:phosphatidyl-myo-inositol dimannoside synthase
MRILMLNNEFPPLGGGTGTVNHALLERFAQVSDISIDLVTSALGRRAESECFAERVTLHKVPVHNRNIHHSSNRELLTYAARALGKSLELHKEHKYDLCFAWSAVPAGAVALTLRRLKGLPYVVRVCGPDIPGFERRYGPLYPVLTPTIRSVWRGAAEVVAKCADEAAMIHAVDSGIDVTLVPNGVDLTRFRSPAVELSGPLRVLCVARLIERKGQHHLIEALRRLVDIGTDIVVELVGTGDAEPALRALAQRLGVAERVRFSGYVPREMIAERYASADVFVLPSYSEGMSVATLEAMAAGLPLVVTRTGGTAELVADGENGLTFTWGDVERLIAHLRRLHDDRAVARRMGAHSRRRAESFSWEAAATRYVQMFEQLTTGWPPMHAQPSSKGT